MKKITKIVEVKTPNCSHCKAIEPEYIKLKEKHPEVEFKEVIYPMDVEAKKYMEQFSIRSAPTFIVETQIEESYDNWKEEKAVKFEELESLFNE